MTYRVAYKESNGQPTNGEYITGSWRTAVARARLYARSCLLERSGGHAWISDLTQGEDSEDVWVWHEHAEGGYGTWIDSNGAQHTVRL